MTADMAWPIRLGCHRREHFDRKMGTERFVQTLVIISHSSGVLLESLLVNDFPYSARCHLHINTHTSSSHLSFIFVAYPDEHVID